MKHIVITGSTRGIGYGLAAAFLQRGCAVTVNGRSSASVQSAIDSLREGQNGAQIAGQAGSVTDLDDLRALWETAVSAFGRVDVWINNAGLGHDTKPAWELSSDTVKSVVDVNILGMMYGARVAMRRMLVQGGGQIYNMEGFGSRGNIRPGMSVYGTSKAAVRYFSKALIEEAEETAVQVGILAPGMVMTDMVLGQYQDKPEELAQHKRIFNIIGDRVENVAPWLADRILANDKNGAHFVYAPPAKLAWRFLTAPFTNRDVFPDSHTT